jgi:hypothetical protein
MLRPFAQVPHQLCGVALMLLVLLLLGSFY